jgi:hypothetical protein
MLCTPRSVDEGRSEEVGREIEAKAFEEPREVGDRKGDERS